MWRLLYATLMCRLDYEKAVERTTPSPSGKLLLAVAAIVVGMVHSVYCAVVSFQLFRVAGGITTTGRWTTYGGIDHSWTNFAWLPGGLLLWMTDGPSPVNLLAFLSLLGGSVFTGVVTTNVGVNIIRGSRQFGRYRWQVWICVLAWLAWVPVPVKMTLTYWHTVAF